MSTTEHDPNSADTGGQATGGNSQGGGAPISLDDATVNALLSHPTFQSKIAEMAQVEAGKTGQAIKDRRIAGLQNQVNDILNVLDLSPEQKKQVQEYQKDQLITDMNNRLNELTGGSSSGQVASQAGGTPVNIIGAFSQAGYDPNAISLEDWEWAEAFKGDDVALANALAKRRLGGAPATQPEPNLAGIMPTGQTLPTPQSGSQAALRANYNAEVAKIRPGDVGSLTALKAKYRKQGLDIF